MRRRLFALFLVFTVASCSQVTNPPFTSFSDGGDWALYGALKYQIGESTEIIEVPRGFVTDFASSPWWSWAMIPRIGKYQFAAVVHDYLYWEQLCTKEEADQILYFAMKEANVSAFERISIYEAVHRAGLKAWNENARNRQKGLPRIIPEEFMDILPGITWADYQQQLFKKGVRAEQRGSRPSYCSALKSVNTVAEH